MVPLSYLKLWNYKYRPSRRIRPVVVVRLSVRSVVRPVVVRPLYVRPVMSSVRPSVPSSVRSSVRRRRTSSVRPSGRPSVVIVPSFVRPSVCPLL